MVCGDEIHDAEGKAFDLRKGCDLVRLMQRAVRLDQDVYRQVFPSGLFRGTVDDLERATHVRERVDFGKDQVSELLCSSLADDADVLLEAGVGDVMNSGTNAVELVVVALDDGRHQFCVCLFVAGTRAILAIEGDVEYRAKLLLQGNRLLHELLGAGVVIAYRNRYRLVLALE